MTKRALTATVLIAFILLAGFGLYMPTMNHEGHEMGCPFSPGSAALCSPLAHLEHWQSASVTILSELVVLVAIALVFLKIPYPIPKINPQYRRYRLLARAPLRPFLLQELFSQGLLNPKVP